ncbi:NAD(P)H-binding protein [Nocardia sp. NPDC052112]|uniref:NAD(P)-dependent oxidoreductase n=1 Tax=Nocardia sp. NPDC052112 TaxID=3155646 RepID=UPI0034153FE9
MATIAVFGAAGAGGRRIATEATSRGHDVLSIVRNIERAQADSRTKVMRGDGTDVEFITGLAANVDAIVVAVGNPSRSPVLDVAQTMVEAITSLDSLRPRLLHMGGGGSLLTPEGTRILDAPNFPPAFLQSARTQAAALDFYRLHAADCGVTWTFVSPPPVHFEPGERRGTYRTALDTPVVGKDGKAVLSYEDLAVAMVDEIENARFLNTRFTAGY